MAKQKKNDLEMDAKKYDSSSISTLEYPENVQKRPTMYISSIGIEGVSHLIREIYDNALDEAMNGFGNKITITINKDENSVEVQDEGRGIPIDNNILETLVTKLHSGSKFENGAYGRSSGLNGVGLGCVNALSDLLEITVFKDGNEYYQQFSLGKPVDNIKKVKKTKKHGTTMKFIPNEKYLRLTDTPKEEWINEELFKDYLIRNSYLNKGITLNFIVIKDKKKVINESYCSENGIVDLVANIAEKNTGLLTKDIFYIHELDKKTNIDVEIALSYTKDSNNDFTETYCNGIYLSEGGTQITGLRKGLTSVLKKGCQESGLITKRDKDLEINGEDVREGLVCIVSIKHPDPLYSGQNKQKLNNTEVQGIINKYINDFLTEWLSYNPEDSKLIFKKNIGAARGRTAAQKARDKEYKVSKSTFDSLSDISKLADCESKDPKEREIYIVEGNSASGSAKQGRDPYFQAIYALRGKPLNTYDYTDIHKMLNPKNTMYNKELADLILSLNCGLDDKYDDNKLKYHKVFIMTDADTDGKHITDLILTFFLMHCRGLLEMNRVFLALSPFYVVKDNGKTIYITDDNEYNMFITERIFNNFTVNKADDTSSTLIKKKELAKLFKISKSYLNELNRLNNLMSLPNDILEFLIFNFIQYDMKDVFTIFEESYDESFKIKIKKNEMFIKGYYKNEYYELIINEETFDKLSTAISIIEDNNLIEYQYLEISSKKNSYEVINYYLGEGLNYLIKVASPKYRNRIKGKPLPLISVMV